MPGIGSGCTGVYSITSITSIAWFAHPIALRSSKETEGDAGERRDATWVVCGSIVGCSYPPVDRRSSCELQTLRTACLLPMQTPSQTPFATQYTLPLLKERNQILSVTQSGGRTPETRHRRGALLELYYFIHRRPFFLFILAHILHTSVKMRAHNVASAAGTGALLLAVSANAEAVFQVGIERCCLLCDYRLGLEGMRHELWRVSCNFGSTLPCTTPGQDQS